MSDSLIKDLWHTFKFAIGYYRADKKSLLRRGIDVSFPWLLVSLCVIAIGHEAGLASAQDVYRVLGVITIILGIDLSLVLDLSLIFDLLLGDMFGILGFGIS